MTISLATTQDFSLDGLNIRPATREVAHGDEIVRLEPRVMQVLVLLTQKSGQPVTRDELISECWDNLVVGDDAIQRCIGRLRRISSAYGGFEIETLPKIGYRLKLTNASDKPPIKRDSPDDALTQPSVVFRRVGVWPEGAPELAFAELLADDVTAALSLDRDLQVHAWRSGEPQTEYLIDLDLSCRGETWRLSVQILDAASARILLTHTINTLDLDLNIEGSIPSDDLVIDVASKVSNELHALIEKRALQHEAPSSAWEAVIRANTAYQRINLDSLEFAIAEGRRAVSLDPNYAAAHAALANALAAHNEVGGARNAEEAREARRHCDMALALDHDDPTVLAWVGNALGMATRPPEGLAISERAAQLAPAHPIAHLYLSRQYMYHNRPKEALACLDTHDRVAPRFPWPYYVQFMRGLAEFMAGRADVALNHVRQSSYMNPDYPYSWIAQIIALMTLGQQEEAKQVAARLKEIEGDDSLNLQLDRLAHSYPNPTLAAGLQDLLRAAWG